MSKREWIFSQKFPGYAVAQKHVRKFALAHSFVLGSEHNFSNKFLKNEQKKILISYQTVVSIKLHFNDD